MNPLDPTDATIVRIRDKGAVKELAYDGAMTAHTGTLWWGTAVGYRAMQAAAQALSSDGLWSRDGLYVVGAHPAPVCATPSTTSPAWWPKTATRSCSTTIAA